MRIRLFATIGLCLLLAGCASTPAAGQGFRWFPKLPIQRDIKMKTLGGMQFWGDVAWHRGWRIQHNVIFKQHRLLDPHNNRYASGTLEECKKKLEEIKKEKKLPKLSGHAVILIHGIVRSSKSFHKMAEALRKDGYTVVGFDYPSTQVEISQSAEYLDQLIRSLDGIEKISFVVHSMGGLVVRCYLTKHHDERIERMVMLGVPNLGAKMADLLKNNLLFKMIFGPAGKQLGVNGGFIDSLPTPKFEFGIVAGCRGQDCGYNPLVPGDDDGTVSVECTRLPGASDFVTVPALHSFMMNNADTIAYTRNFLKTGQFRKDGPKQPIPLPETEKSAESEKPQEGETGRMGEGEKVTVDDRR